MEENFDSPQLSPQHTPTPDAELKTMAQQLLDELRNLAFSDIAEMFDEANCLLPVQSMSPEIRRAIASIEVEELYRGTGIAKELVGYTKKVKLWDKKQSITEFMRHLGMFVDRLEQKQTIEIKRVSFNEARA